MATPDMDSISMAISSPAPVPVPVPAEGTPGTTTTTAAAAATAPAKQRSSLDSTYPVLVPFEAALRFDEARFEGWAGGLLAGAEREKDKEVDGKDDSEMSEGEMTGTGTGTETETETAWTGTEGFTVVEGGSASERGVEEAEKEKEVKGVSPAPDSGNAFVNALLASTSTSATTNPTTTTTTTPPPNMTLTTNAMPAHTSTLSPTLDLFVELSQGISPGRRNDLLTQAWSENPLETLKIIFNNRSIHLGKGEKDNFYACLGWLKGQGVKGEKTVLGNLAVVVDRVIEKPKKEKKEKEGDKMDVDVGEKDEKEVIEETEEKEEEKEARALSHGYWKDLLNVCTLEVQDAFTVVGDTHHILNPAGAKPAVKGQKGRKSRRNPRVSKRSSNSGPSEKKEKAKLAPGEALHLQKEAKHAAEKQTHEKFLAKFNNPTSPFYKILHLTIARLFATQLQKDLALLNSNNPKFLCKISLAAKWAPSLEGLHDRRTFLASSIAEYLFPETHPLIQNSPHPHLTREAYLKLARELYRRTYLTPLRKALLIVERPLSARQYSQINYPTVPSIAMSRYTKAFSKNDGTRFVAYLTKVAEGKVQISGATLTPGNMAKQAFNASRGEVQELVMDGQWNSLVQSVKDRGTFDNVIAICDTSGSMEYPNFKDGTSPLNQAVGLSLLLSEVAKEPWKGLIISFNEKPVLVNIYDSSHAGASTGDNPDGINPPTKFTFHQKIAAMHSIPWGYNTNFLAVFEDLILPLAVKNKVPQEDMLKKVFVFSDMQFDVAQQGGGEANLWETGYQRLVRVYKENGYEVPEIVYWNLAGQVATGGSSMPVEKDVEGVAIVSGFGAGMLKAFLDGAEDGEEVEEMEVEVEDEDVVMVSVEGDEVVEIEQGTGGKKVKKVKKKLSPIETMRKMLANKAYEGLRVYEQGTG